MLSEDFELIEIIGELLRNNTHKFLPMPLHCYDNTLDVPKSGKAVDGIYWQLVTEPSVNQPAVSIIASRKLPFQGTRYYSR